MKSERLAAARRRAVAAHGEQRYGEHPYAVHLDDVAAVLAAAGLPEDEQVAGFLHDTLEDTTLTQEAIQSEFGVASAEMVQAVSGFGNSRAARQADIRRKLAAYPRAINVKLGDRYCNMRRAFQEGNRSLFVWYREELPLYAPLFQSAHPTLQGWMHELLDEAAKAGW